MEGAGVPVTAGLTKLNPFSTDQCDFQETCLVGSGCSRVNCNYRIHCSDCNPGIKGIRKPAGAKNRSIYLGQTGTSLHKRMKSHLGGVSGGGVLGKHVQEHHEGSRGNQASLFKMELLKGSRTVLDRQVQEGTLISFDLAKHYQEVREGVQKPRQVLNSRREFYQPGLIVSRATGILY